MRQSLQAIVAVGLMAMAASAARADIVTGSYTFGGTTTPTTQTGPWTMTADPNTFAVLRFVPDVTLPFSAYTSLIYNYDAVVGGIGGGSPRATFVLNSGDTFDVQWGPAGSYVDGTIGAGLSTGNLLSFTETGRYDTSQIAGGSPYTDRASALALIGNQTVNRISLVIDAYAGMPGGDIKNFVINSVSVEAVPEAGAAWLGAAVVSVAGLAYGGRKLVNRKWAAA
jgi:hypothetical protein